MNLKVFSSTLKQFTISDSLSVLKIIPTADKYSSESSAERTC